MLSITKKHAVVNVKEGKSDVKTDNLRARFTADESSVFFGDVIIQRPDRNFT